MRLNKESEEWKFFIGLIEERIEAHRRSMEAEGTPAEELPYERAKLRALMTIKQKAEEAVNHAAR